MLDGKTAKLRSCDVASKSFDDAFKNVSIRGKNVVSDPDPRLHGWWGSDDDDETTMTHQAVLEGIPSLQLENP